MEKTNGMTEDGSHEEPRRSINAKSCREKLMDLLARRNHSELELRQKLGRAYSSEEIELAIQEARDSGWLSPPEEIAERVAVELGRKKKGHRFINQFLRNKGLPPVAKDLEEEARKGLALIEAKLAKSGPFDYEEQRKIHRLLANRGFDDETIRRVMRSPGPEADSDLVDETNDDANDGD